MAGEKIVKLKCIDKKDTVILLCYVFITGCLFNGFIAYFSGLYIEVLCNAAIIILCAYICFYTFIVLRWEGKFYYSFKHIKIQEKID